MTTSSDEHAVLAALTASAPSGAPTVWSDYYEDTTNIIEDEGDDNGEYLFDITLSLRFYMILALVIVLCYKLKAFYRHRLQQRRERNTENILPGQSPTTNNGGPETLHHTTFGGFARQSNGAFNTNITISVDDLIGLYAKTFDHNGHQLRLEHRHLVLSHDDQDHDDEGSTTTTTNCCAAIDDADTSSGDIELGNMSGSGDQKNRKRGDDEDDKDNHHDPNDSSKSNNEETTATLCFDRRNKNAEHTTDEEDEDGKKKQEESMIRCDGTCFFNIR